MALQIEPAFLYSIREQSSYSWRKMICELIDNSFDAEASRVDLHWPGGNVFRIEDDGRGCDDLMRMITLGRRHEHPTNDVGKYGVGSKMALIWLWGQSRIESATERGSHEITVDWEEVASGCSEFPERQETGTRDRIGTKIECMYERKSPALDRIIPDLQRTYTPGLEIGKRIVVWGSGKRPASSLTSVRWPITTEELDDVIEVAGRSVRIRMGIVAEGVANPYDHGFSFERSYRVIKETTLGANGFSVGRIAARITLGKEWRLSTHKDDFEEFQDELGEAIYDRCGEMMESASNQTTTIEDRQFNAELAGIVIAASRTRREKREPSESVTGTVEPKNTGRRRATATQSTDQPGSVIDTRGSRSSRKSGFTVDTYSDQDGSLSFGYYDSDGNRVMLNTANAWLLERYKARNQDTMLPIIYGILAGFQFLDSRVRVPLFARELGDFATQWGTAVSEAAESAVMS